MPSLWSQNPEGVAKAQSRSWPHTFTLWPFWIREPLTPGAFCGVLTAPPALATAVGTVHTWIRRGGPRSVGAALPAVSRGRSKHCLELSHTPGVPVSVPGRPRCPLCVLSFPFPTIAWQEDPGTASPLTRGHPYPLPICQLPLPVPQPLRCWLGPPGQAGLSFSLFLPEAQRQPLGTKMGPCPSCPLRHGGAWPAAWLSTHFVICSWSLRPHKRPSHTSPLDPAARNWSVAGQWQPALL